MIKTRKVVIKDVSYNPPMEMEFLIKDHVNKYHLVNDVDEKYIGKHAIFWFVIESSKWKDKRFTNLILKHIEM